MANRNKRLSTQALLTQRAVAVLSEHRDWRRWPPARQIDYLFSVRWAEDFYDQVGADSALGQLYVHCVAGRPKAEHEPMRQFLLGLARRRGLLLTRPELAPVLAQLGAHYRYRLRDLTDWTPQRKNVYAQLESLLRHLFDQYGDVPAWVLNAWTATRVNNLSFNLPLLTIHLGRGYSLRSFTGRRLPLTKRLEHEMRQAPAACTLAEAYGLTETSPILIGNPESADRRPGYIGLPFPDTDIRIANPENLDEDMPYGEAGEILARGPQVFGGYLADAPATAAAFQDGWFRDPAPVELRP